MSMYIYSDKKMTRAYVTLHVAESADYDCLVLH